MKLATASLVTILIVLIMASCGKDPAIDDGGNPGGGGGTKISLPVLGTLSVSQITNVSAIIKVPITSTGGANIIEGGVTLNGDANKVQAVLSGSEFSVTLGNLLSNNTYVIKGYAINSVGVAYTIETSFTTGTIIIPTAGKIKDVDGNAYDTVRIGKQTWMVQNLKVTHYRDGSAITVITDNAAWLDTPNGAGAMCYYNNDAANATTYGALYNWEAAASSKGLAPAGWHVPSLAEWTELETLFGPYYEGGQYVKEAGTTHWLAPNYKANNQTGFTALPAGYRKATGQYIGIGELAIWWSTNTQKTAQCSNIGAELSSDELFNTRSGMSIRCIKDK